LSLPRKKILLVEDEAHLAFTLQFNLQEEGYEVIPAVNGLIALEKFQQMSPFDVIILDIMIPEMDGFQVAKQIRLQDKKIGILMLTARATDEDRLRGLKLGADDYITKPFHLQELLMRVARMAQRSELFSASSSPSSGRLQYGPFELNSDDLTLNGPEGEQVLTVLEADILKEFIINKNKVLSRDHLLDQVWGLRGDIETRTVDNFVARLRKLIEDDPSQPKRLISVRGRGYKLVSEESKTT
jgi:DNA-binding response OmpR family regulator